MYMYLAILAYLANQMMGLQVIDITDPVNPTIVGFS